jgi:penicillin amidase
VTTRFGENPADWNYGEIHTWTPYHPLNDVPVIGSFFRRGPFEVPGSATTIGVFSGYWNGFSGKFSVSHGASMRWVADTQDPDNSRAVLPVGQSGHPFDPHYDDQLETYLAGELRPVYWSDEAMEAATVSRLQLHP